jgi:transposase InsO family protein
MAPERFGIHPSRPAFWPATVYGYRRVMAELQHRGTVVNHKRVLRLMRADNLLVVRKQWFVFTTDSRYDYAVYSNLAPCLNLTGIDQLWVAYITYVRLREAFCIWLLWRTPTRARLWAGNWRRISAPNWLWVRW